jgi:hypothetical protein
MLYTRRQRSTRGLAFALLGAVGVLCGAPWLFAAATPAERVDIEQLRANYQRPPSTPYPDDNQRRA